MRTRCSYPWLAVLLTALALGAATQPDRETLQRRLRDSDAETRLKAAVVLLKDIDPTHREALTVLRTSLRDNTRRSSADVEELARGNGAVLKLLIQTGTDQKVQSNARIRVLLELKTLGAAAKEGIPKLVNCLDESLEIAMYAAAVLGAMKGEAKAAIPRLEKYVKEDRTPLLWIDWRVAELAGMLVQIDPGNEVAIHYLARQLKGWSYEHRSTGVYGLRDCPKLPRDALNELEQIAQKDPYDGLRREAQAILDKHKGPK